MRKVFLGIMILGLLLTVTGCEWQVNYNLAEQIEFLPESGADQYVMCSSLQMGVQEIDFQKYAGKKVYVSTNGGTEYTGSVLQSLVLERLHKVEATILERLSDEEKKKGLKEESGDFELKFNILTCGIHSYDGLIRKHIEGLAMISLEETNRDQVTATYPGKLERYQYEKWVFSSYFIAITLVFIMMGLLLGLNKLLNRNSKGAKGVG